MPWGVQSQEWGPGSSALPSRLTAQHGCQRAGVRTAGGWRLENGLPKEICGLGYIPP